MILDVTLNKKNVITLFVICCASVFLWFYFLNRDIARVGVYLLAIVGLFQIFKDGDKSSGKEFLLKVGVVFVVLLLLAIYLGSECCGGQDYYSKPFIHMLVLFPFVLLNMYLKGWMKWLLNVSLFYVVACIFSYALSDNPLHSAKYFESHYAVYLLVAPIAYVVHKCNIRTTTILIIFAISGIIIGFGAIADLTGFARSQYWLFDKYPVVPNLDTVGIGLGMNSIHFAIVAAAVLSVVLACLSSIYISLNKTQVILAIAGILFLVFALAMSGVRSAWISLPFVFIIPFAFSSWSIKEKSSVFALLIIGFVILYQISYVQKRVGLVSEQVTEYVNSTDVNDNVRTSTSVGLRLELWRAAWEVFLTKPVIGVGPGNFRSTMQDICLGSSGEFNKSIEIYKNPHSLYFKALAERGVLGLVSTISVLVLPGLFFLLHLRKSYSDNIRAIALSGVLVVIVYSLGGLTIGSLHKTELSIFYIFFSALFFGLLFTERKV